MNTNQIKFAFFGSSRFSVIVLEELARQGFTPTLVITTPDKPKGRKLEITPTPVKEWALQKNIPVVDPTKLDADFSAGLKSRDLELYVVASYGKIIPGNIIEIPEHKTLNIHPSLLPRYRGPSPLQTAILDDTKNTGVSIMRIDAQVDHGPILAQEEVQIDEWPTYEDFEEMMATRGAQLLAKVMPEWVAGKITAKDQDHTQATFTRKISKENGEINLSDDPYTNFRKIQAYHEWPQAFFFAVKKGKKIRVKITQASFKDGKCLIEKVIPEGVKEMEYSVFEKSL